MSDGGRAYLTMAVGDSRYLEMAVDLALSLRAWTTLPIVLAADSLLAGAASRFAETVYVDADCIVLADPSHIWKGVGSGPLTMVGERLGLADDEYHHGFSTRYIMERLGLDAYLKTNSGVFHFRREGGRGALEACLRCHLDEVRPRLASRLRP